MDLDKENDYRKFEKLIALAKKGDSRAFGSIYEEYFSPIFRYLYFRTNSKQEAEDLTQIVFLKAWQNIKKFEITNKPILAWLYTISRNAFIDFINSKNRKKEVINEELLKNVKSSNSVPPDEKISSLETDLIIRNAIKQLSPEQEEVIILKFIEGKSHQEISQIMNKSEEAIRAISSRAIKSLRVKMPNYL